MIFVLNFSLFSFFSLHSSANVEFNLDKHMPSQYTYEAEKNNCIPFETQSNPCCNFFEYFVEKMKTRAQESWKNLCNFCDVKDNIYLNYSIVFYILKLVVAEFKNILQHLPEDSYIYTHIKSNKTGKIERIFCHCVLDKQEVHVISITQLDDFGYILNQIEFQFSQFRNNLQHKILIETLCMLLRNINFLYELLIHLTTKFGSLLKYDPFDEVNTSVLKDDKIFTQFSYSNFFIKNYVCCFDALSAVIEEVSNILHMEFIDNMDTGEYADFNCVLYMGTTIEVINRGFYVNEIPSDMRWFNINSSVFFYGMPWADSYFICIRSKFLYRIYLLKLMKNIDNLICFSDFSFDIFSKGKIFEMKSELKENFGILYGNLLQIISKIIEFTKIAKLPPKDVILLDFVSNFKPTSLRNQDFVTSGIDANGLSMVLLWLYKNMSIFMIDPKNSNPLSIELCFGYLCMMCLEKIELIEKQWELMNEQIQILIDHHRWEGIEKSLDERLSFIYNIGFHDIKHIVSLIDEIWIICSRYNSKIWDKHKELQFLRENVKLLIEDKNFIKF